jgi:putative ABC transport system permease protein
LIPKLGGTTLIREEVSRMNPRALAEGVLLDARHALRVIRLNPGFSAAAILTLALGIGANSAMFSVLSAVLIRPLPYPAADALVGVSNRLVIQGQVFENADLSPAMYLACKEHARVFDSFGVWAVGAATVSGLGDPEQLVSVTATQGVLPTLGIQPHIGRRFDREDDSPGTPQTVILSYGYWQRRFGGDPSASGPGGESDPGRPGRRPRSGVRVCRVARAGDRGPR